MSSPHGKFPSKLVHPNYGDFTTKGIGDFTTVSLSDAFTLFKVSIYFTIYNMNHVYIVCRSVL